MRNRTKKIPQIAWAEKGQLDKLVHIGLFFFLVIIFSFPFSKSLITKQTRLKWFLSFAVTGILYGVAVEFIQKYYIPHRSFDINDMIADAIGCIAGYCCVRQFFTNKI